MMELRQAVEKTITQVTNQPAKVTLESPCGGGCINRAAVMRLEDGRSFFVKSNPSPLPGMFPREVEGLKALAEAQAIRVPRPLATGGDPDSVVPDTTPFILMEHIESGRERANFFETFGHQFAQLHKSTQSDPCGFERDNYIGATPQPNKWSMNWVEFWGEQRLGYQFALAQDNGMADERFNDLADRLLNRLDELIGEPAELNCLLHGDLWPGNFLADGNGNPVLIDPAAYYGRREADLAMTMLFGGFDARFYKAYEEVWPLAEGWQDRVEIYKLYHLLNHLNLFGGSYKGGCMKIMERFAG